MTQNMRRRAAHFMSRLAQPAGQLAALQGQLPVQVQLLQDGHAQM